MSPAANTHSLSLVYNYRYPRNRRRPGTGPGRFTLDLIQLKKAARNDSQFLDGQVRSFSKTTPIRSVAHPRERLLGEETPITSVVTSISQRRSNPSSDTESPRTPAWRLPVVQPNAARTFCSNPVGVASRATTRQPIPADSGKSASCVSPENRHPEVCRPTATS